MIVVHHFAGYHNWPNLHGVNLGSGVPFFFVLSGFVLQYAYPRIETKSDAYTFVIQRIARIWPLHVVTLVATILLIEFDWVGAHRHPDFVVMHIFLLHAWYPIQDLSYGLNGPSWSVSTELFFYLTFPALVNVRRPAHIVGLGVLIASFFVFTTHIGCLGRVNFESTGGLSCQCLGATFPIPRLIEFFTGILLCRAYNTLRAMPALVLSRSVWTILEVVALTACGLCIVYFYDVASLFVPEGLKPTLVYVWILNVGVFPVFALVILIMAFQRGLISSVLSARPFVLAGEISFSIYLTHMIALKAIAERPQLFDHWPRPALFAAVSLVVFGVSYLTYRYIETPVRHFVKMKRSKGYAVPIRAL